MGVSNAQDDEQECVAYGHSQIIGPLGNVLRVCEDHRGDEIVSHDISMELMENVRRSMIPLESSRRKQVYEDALRSAQSNPTAMMRPPTGMD
jgi:predicted amidohydrolase